MTDPTPSPTEEQPNQPDLRFGLSRAIQIQSEDFRVRCPQIKLELDLIEDENLLPQNLCLALYEAYLEALDRAACLAQAGAVWVRYYPSARHMVLEIRDSEEKFPVPVDQAGLQAVVDGIGGQVQAVSQPGQGTKIIIKAPFAK